MTHPALLTTVATCALLALTGCRTVVEPRHDELGDAERRAVYQRIANALPRANPGWGSPPGIVEMARSTKAEGAPAEPEPLTANEHGFRATLEVYRPRTLWIPYAAIRQVSYGWKPVPNVLLAPLLVVPLQIGRATLIVDAGQVPGFFERLERDLKRLEAISREIGMGGPWAHAQDVRAALAEVEAEHGPRHLALHFDYSAMIPAWLPWGGDARRTAEAFAWAMAHPDAATLEPAPEDDARGADAAEAERRPPS